jgi:hypothetical protein
MIDWLEYLGYIASLIVLVSLLMSSVKKLRWINLAGSLLFATYGFLIGSLPVGLMNTGIVMINLYYLFQMYRKTDYFQLMCTEEVDYLKHFVSFYKENMKSFFEFDENLVYDKEFKVFILRNLIPAGILLGKAHNEDTLEILVDYATPQFRDFKIANFLFNENKNFFIEKGFTKLITKPGNLKHQKYLEKIGFKKVNSENYIKEL